eukprot:TRINITY_DN67210_c4_g7_i1.p1 TRINITY_DN67210_c4_g7~~TRINITY_DN67210_c4_g7_i1.p1  ORF type:complete len:250 (-),score=29.48 TRINITY_DN67210_c4_g7_i1:442-1191(-)
MSTADVPILYHDPTSEPSRAVHWWAMEAGIPLKVKLTWLAEGAIRTPEFLKINPRHQVPALTHGDDFCLSEAHAIMLYLVELNGLTEKWIGRTPKERAITNMHLSWYHTNLRQKSTYDYFLPMFIAPYFHGTPQPSTEEQEKLRSKFKECYKQLADFLEGKKFLGGEGPLLADFLMLPELTSLDLDPQRKEYMPVAVLEYIERSRALPCSAKAHKTWDAFWPIIQAHVCNGAAKDDSWKVGTDADFSLP